MPDPTDDLRSTEEAIASDADSVRSMEGEKAELDPTDPQVAHLSRQVKRITSEMDAKAGAELELAEGAKSD